MYPPQQQPYIPPTQQQVPTVIVQQPQYVVNPPANGPTVYVHPQQQPSVIIEERTVVREKPRVIGLRSKSFHKFSLRLDLEQELQWLQVWP